MASEVATKAPDQKAGDAVRREAARMTRRFVALSFCRADLLFELDHTSHIVFSAGTTNELLGKTTQDLAGKSFGEFLADEDRKMMYELLDSADVDGRIDDVEVRMHVAGGKMVDATVAGYQVPDFDNHFFIAVRVGQKKRPQARRRDSDKDMDTGVVSQEAFAGVAAERIRAIQQSGGEAKMTMVKINNLTEAQKSMSEEAQEKLMGTIGSILNAQSMGGDSAGRVGEEGFSFIHADDVDTDSVSQQIENAARELTPEGVQVSSKAQTISADSDSLSDEQMSEAIMYTMRKFTDGKLAPDAASMSGQFETMMAETTKSVEKFKVICRTRDFDLNFMPICNLTTEKVHHLEALTRFRGDFAGDSPYELITLAEEIGIIAEFDLAVARKSVDLINQAAIGPKLPPIAVNVSGHSISSDDFVRELSALLRKAENLSSMISLEITESAAITEFERVNANIQQFRERGFHVALDDFGAGAASFDYLNSFDIDVVKFDGQVVRRAYATTKGKAFLGSMASLCKETGVETIAEMVEDKELATFLRECGVKYGQGYYFGKPGPDPRAFK